MPSPVQRRLRALADQALHLAGDGDRAANWMAARQHGLAHRDQAERCGLGRNARAGRCARGTWRRLYPRVYLVGAQPPTERAQLLAATLDAGWYAACTGRSGAFAYGLIDRPGRLIHIAMIGRHNAARRPGVRVHRPHDLSWDDVRFDQGIPLTSPVETLLALAADLDVDELEAVVALAISRRLVTAQALSVPGGRPGAASLRRAARAPALTRSGNERRLLALIHRAELPPPETNVVVAEKELDMYWAEARLGVEVDAYSTHGSSAAFEDDHKVDADLEAADVRVVRFTGRRIREHPEAVVAKLAAILTLRLGGLPVQRRR